MERGCARPTCEIPTDDAGNNCREKNRTKNSAQWHILFLHGFFYIRLRNVFVANVRYEDDDADNHSYSCRSKCIGPSKVVTHDRRDEVAEEGSDVDTHVK